VATDYDTPRKTDEELHEESLEELKAKRVDAQSGQIDVDEAEAAENLELPGADLSGEELAVRCQSRPMNLLVHDASWCITLRNLLKAKAPRRSAKSAIKIAVCKECN